MPSAQQFEPETPAHMQYTDVWHLAEGPDPTLLKGYLRWLVDDPDRFASAVDSMQWLPVGLNALTVARSVDPASGIVDQILQLNFYHGDYPGNEDPHAHSRNASTTWYAHPTARQHITRHFLLPEKAKPITDLPLSERQIVANCITDYRDGRRPGYSPVPLGTRLILELSETRVAPLGSQSFGSLEVHHVGFEGPGVAVSVHHKQAEEPAVLGTFGGLVSYKGLSPLQAEAVTAARAAVTAQLSCDTSSVTLNFRPRLGPTTMVFPPLDFDLALMEAVPTSTPPSISERLLLGGLATAEFLAEAA